MKTKRPSAVKIIMPLLFGVAALGLWEALVRLYTIPVFILPAPTAIFSALSAHFPSLMLALWETLKITLLSFSLAMVLGISMAVFFTRARWLELTLYPYVVILQVTPVIAIAPLILIWVGLERIQLALVIIATIIAFFPILSNTISGLRSVDPNLRALFTLYDASIAARLLRLELPSALPHIITGAKISGGLALIGAVMAEFVAGTGTATGLAWRLIEATHRLHNDIAFAALLLLSFLGITFFYILHFIGWLLLRNWHHSQRER